jgi:hypothetical protein
MTPNAAQAAAAATVTVVSVVVVAVSVVVVGAVVGWARGIGPAENGLVGLKLILVLALGAV